MTKDVVTVSKATSLKEAASLLAKLRIHGMPVMDDKENIIGIITESDFFLKDNSNIYLPTFFEFVKSGRGNPAYDAQAYKLEKISKVEDIMSEGCITIDSEKSVEEVVKMFKEYKFNSLPVVGENGKLVGIVTIMDVIKLF